MININILPPRTLHLHPHIHNHHRPRRSHSTHPHHHHHHHHRVNRHRPTSSPQFQLYDLNITIIRIVRDIRDIRVISADIRVACEYYIYIYIYHIIQPVSLNSLNSPDMKEDKQYVYMCERDKHTQRERERESTYSVLVRNSWEGSTSLSE